MTGTANGVERAEEQNPRHQDSLLTCLLIIARQHDLPGSASSATCGLPLQDGRLTPSLFDRAARRLGLASQLVERPLKQFDDLSVPAVLLLDGDRACVLLSMSHDGNARVQLPDNPDGEQTTTIEALTGQYSGYALLVSPRHRYDARTPLSSQLDKDAHWFWGTLAHSWRIYRDIIIASIAVNMFALAVPLFIMNVYDRVVPNQAFETLWVLAVGVALVFVFDFIVKGLRGHFIDLAGRKADVELSARLYERVLGIRLDARPPSSGAFANNLREFDSVRDFFTSLTLSGFVDLPFSLLFLSVIWFIAGPLVWIPLSALPLVIGYGLIIQPVLRDAAEKSMRANAQKNATLVESLVEAEAVKAMGVEGRVQQQLESTVAEHAQHSARARHWALSVSNVTALLQQLVSAGVVVYGVYLINAGVLSLGALIATVILSGRAVAPLAQIAGLLTRYHQTETALRALNEVMKLPIERSDDQVYVSRPALRGAISFDHVTFHYPQQDVAALVDASFAIEAGEKVAIIGRVGSGKTTVNRLIAGLYRATKGAVKIDGIDSRQIDPADLRANIAYVSQDSQLLYGSIRDNITMGLRNVDDEQIVEAARMAGVDRFVDLHPLGFDMPVGEYGQQLSGGQKQAVALARALVQDAPMLLLDEPTGSMDNSSEEQIKQQLAKLPGEKTLVLITHRASLLDLVERVIVLDNGKIVADGPKAQVLDALRANRIKQGR